MTTTNPLLKATRAAFTELTTSEAQEWYRAQAQATAAGAKAIAHRGIATVGHLLRPKPELLTVGGVTVPAEATELPSPSVPFGWAAIEANDVAAVPELEEDATELRPWIEGAKADSVVVGEVESTDLLSFESEVSEAL